MVPLCRHRILPGLLNTLEVILEARAQLADVSLALLLMRVHLGVKRLLSGADEVIGLLAADTRRLLDLGHLLCDRSHLACFQALEWKGTNKTKRKKIYFSLNKIY